MEYPCKTILCSVLFLDIVEYSKTSVSGEISLKERFNAFLSASIRDVPFDDRIILDTGDGAAISFIGDIGDALHVALHMGKLLQSDVAHMEPPLLVRMGINVGPVRLVKDINGQPNMIGDGINVAQRVMSFSEPGQILVTRSYFEAVSRLSPEYAGIFIFQGSRTDKHVREHEIFATDYLGEITSEPQSDGDVMQKPGKLNALLIYLRKSWQHAAQRLGADAYAAAAAFRAASPKKRTVYLGALAVPLVVVTVLVSKLVHRVPSQPSVIAEKSPDLAVNKPKKTEVKDNTEINQTEVKTAKNKLNPIGFLSVICMERSSVFVDGKGPIAQPPPSIHLDPGNHIVIIIHKEKSKSTSPLYKKMVTIKTGETVRMKPDFCN